MFIKMKHHKSNVVLVINVDIDKYRDFYVSGNQLMLSTYDFETYKDDMGETVKERKRDIITFKSQEEAEYARDAIFNNISTKAPYNKTLDLTLFEQMNESEGRDEFTYLDLRDIANKYKIDPATLRIVDLSNKTKNDEGESGIENVEVDEALEEVVEE